VFIFLIFIDKSLISVIIDNNMDIIIYTDVQKFVVRKIWTLFLIVRKENNF